MAVDENFCLTQEQLAELQHKLVTKLPAKRIPRAKMPYNRGNTFATIPYPAILPVAVRVGGMVLGVFIGIIYETWRQDSRTVKMPSATLERAGIDRQARRRALQRLTEAGVIEVSRQAGSAPQVTLVWPPT
jgi:hypothetical protein